MIHAQPVLQVLDEQERAADQGERQGDLHDQEPVHQRGTGRRTAPLGKRMQRTGRFHPADAEARQRPRGNRRGQPQPGGQRQRPGAGLHGRHDSEPHQQVDGRTCGGDAAQTGQSAEQQVLDRLLTDDAPPACAVDETYRELGTPGLGSHERQNQDRWRGR